MNTDRFLLRENKKSEVGQAQIITAVLFLFLIPTGIIIAQNVTNTSNTSFPLEGNVVSPENVTSHTTAQSNTTVFIHTEEKNTTTSSTSDSDYETNMNTTTSFASPIGKNITDTNSTLSKNHTQPIENNTAQTIKHNETQRTSSEEKTGNGSTQNQKKPKLNVEILSPEKITRGDRVTLQAVITNTGTAEARNVTLHWNLPPGFVAPQEKTYCGTLIPDSECRSEITVDVSYSAELGKNTIKAEVMHE